MGFFSSIGGFLGGKKQTSGLSALPQYAQNAFQGMVNQASGSLLGQAGANKFTPLGQTTQETQAFNLMQQPTTAAGVSGLTNAYMNPFTDYITNNINKQAAGDYSAYKSQLADSGQMGSNRAYLNAAAADEARLNAIGNAQAGQYNTAQQTALGQNQQNITNLLGQGSFQRDLNTKTNTADIQALTQLGQILGFLPQTQTEKDYGNGVLGKASDVAKMAAMLSDFRAKENIKFVGNDGFNIYEYNYIGHPESRFRGVIAQEVMQSRPDAVVIGEDGMLRVFYEKIGLKMEQVQ